MEKPHAESLLTKQELEMRDSNSSSTGSAAGHGKGKFVCLLMKLVRPDAARQGKAGRTSTCLHRASGCAEVGFYAQAGINFEKMHTKMNS